jgi:phosphoribosylaminoimidazole-succinocarboxamide synthase
MKQLLLLLVILLVLDLPLFAKTPTPTPRQSEAATVAPVQVEIADVSDPSAIKLKTSDRGEVICGTLHDCIANYPQLKDGMISETTKKLESEDEITAQHRMQILNSQKIDIPKAVIDKHNARIAKFAKAKEDSLNAAIKKSQVAVKIDNTTSQDQIDAQLKALNDARALAVRAKSKQDELITAGIPISKTTEDAVNAAQPKPAPAPASSPTPTPDGL